MFDSIQSAPLGSSNSADGQATVPAAAASPGTDLPDPSSQIAPSPPFRMSSAEFKILYDRHFALVWRALGRLGVRESDLMDLTQKVFLTAYLKLPEFEGRSLLSTWLWGICRRVAAGYRRSSAMLYEVSTDPVEVEGSIDTRSGFNADDSSLSRQIAVEQMLAKLTHSQRLVFTLSEADGLDCPEIAALLDLSLGTVKSRLRYARQRIRREVRRLAAANAFATKTRQQSTSRVPCRQGRLSSAVVGGLA
ncbi:MAG: sigma-70 family RNA polymerase sigma factor [Polyangiaceae bacterium]